MTGSTPSRAVELEERHRELARDLAAKLVEPLEGEPITYSVAKAMSIPAIREWLAPRLARFEAEVREQAAQTAEWSQQGVCGPLGEEWDKACRRIAKRIRDGWRGRGSRSEEGGGE